MARYKVFINKKLCKGCGICIEICPRNALRFNGINPETGYRNPEQAGECIGCRQCMWYCPDQAIVVVGER